MNGTRGVLTGGGLRAEGVRQRDCDLRRCVDNRVSAEQRHILWAQARQARASGVTGRYRRFGTCALAVAAIALGLAGCGGTGSSSPSVANVSTTTPSTHGASAAPAAPDKNAGQSLVEWAACMRRHGDPDQPDPTIDSHGRINIAIPASAEALSHAVHNGTAPCNGYLAAASSALRAGARDLTPPNQAALVQYAQCMRANGIPDYPDPGTGNETKFPSAIDPNSPFFLRANNICGKKINAPSWWISGAGPPGNISVQSGPMCGNTVCTPSTHGNVTRTSAPTTTTGS